MANTNYKKKYKELNTVDLPIQILRNKFGSTIFDILSQSEDVLIYGGAIRDLFANYDKPCGDLDLIALPLSANYFLGLVNDYGGSFHKLPVDDMESKAYREYARIETPLSITLPDSKNSKIQLVIVKFREEDCHILNHNSHGYFKLKNAREALLRNVKEVDLICCGLVAKVFPSSLKVIEVVSGAFDDCRARKLRMNPYAVHTKNINERVKKLVARGWDKSELSSLSFTPIEW